MEKTATMIDSGDAPRTYWPWPQMYGGTGITGTSTTPTIFENSGVSSALVGDIYINFSAFTRYQCVAPGSPDMAKWVYKGPAGDVGLIGITGATGPVGPSWKNSSDS